MTYTFINNNDLLVAMREDMMNLVIDGDPDIILDAEQTAIKRMKDKLRNRYDMDRVFTPIQQWDATTTFNEGEYVYDEHLDGTEPVGLIYLAKSGNANKKPNDNTIEWETSDPRDRSIVGYLVDIVLYLVHKRINPRKIPDIRRDAYDEAMTWLVDVRDLKENPDLPLLVDDTGEVEIIQSGGEQKREHYF